MNTAPPKTRPIATEGIPLELKGLDRWTAWRWELRGGKWTKPPLNPSTGRHARSNDPGTWGSFEAALGLMRRRRLPGIGFMFHPEDGFAGVDLDGCRNPETGEAEGWAREIVEELDSYTEVSPSRTGLKVFVRGVLPPGRRRKGRIEMYDAARFFTTTGHRLPGAPPSVRDRREELTALHLRVFGVPTTGVANGKRGACESAAHALSDAELVARAMRAANGEKFSRLWAGDASDYASGDNEGRSEADLALCSLLAFWCGPDEARIDKLFRLSGLYRQKWERADYRALTIAAALDRGEFRSGTSNPSPPKRGRVYARRREVIRLA